MHVRTSLVGTWEVFILPRQSDRGRSGKEDSVSDDVRNEAPVAVLLGPCGASYVHYTGFWQATNSEPPGFAGTPGRAGSQN